MKILISAYSCCPGCGSETGVGWRVATEVAKRHDVWVITHERNRDEIETYLAQYDGPRPTFVYHAVPRLLALLQIGFKAQLQYYFWQLTSAKVALELQRRIGFDVVHHAVWARYWMPSGLSGLGVPFVWGPVGGAESIPRGFLAGLGFRGRVSETLRNAARRVARLDPSLRRTVRRASVALVTTRETGDRVLSLGSRRIVQEASTVWYSDSELKYFRELSSSDRKVFRAVCIGRLIHWKGFHLAIEAFARFNRDHPNSELWIINDGPERERLESLARRLGASKTVRFWGQLQTLREVHMKLSQSDVLLHPALHESFGTVCLEAMAAGKPVICLDIGGPAVQVTAATGYRVPVVSQEKAISGIVEALSRLYSDSQLCSRLGQAGRERVVEHYSSDAVLGALDNLYAEMAGAADASARREGGSEGVIPR